jgi:hypothetical protein
LTKWQVGKTKLAPAHSDFQGSEFGKELVQTLAERAELEANYARGLQKLSAKLFKATKDLSSGTISNAWHFIAEDMEATADTHRTIAGALTDELVRPLKAFVEAQHKTRKNVEAIVDKRSRANPINHFKLVIVIWVI